MWSSNPPPRHISRKDENSNSKRYMHPIVHSSIIYNSQDMETIQVPINRWLGASLVVQWLRIHLPMQGTWVRALVQEDSTCRGATESMHHNYWACALESMSHNYWALAPQLLKPTHLQPVLRNKRSHHNEKPTHRNEDPMQPKINKFKKKLSKR